MCALFLLHNKSELYVNLECSSKTTEFVPRYLWIFFIIQINFLLANTHRRQWKHFVKKHAIKCLFFLLPFLFYLFIYNLYLQLGQRSKITNKNQLPSKSKTGVSHSENNSTIFNILNRKARKSLLAFTRYPQKFTNKYCKY